MKFQRDSITVNKLPARIESVGINITKGGEAELRVNSQVIGRLPIRFADTGKPEARPTAGERKGQQSVSN